MNRQLDPAVRMQTKNGHFSFIPVFASCIFIGIGLAIYSHEILGFD